MMASCEKCWSRAYERFIAHPYKSQMEHYQEILTEVSVYGINCTLKEQAGEFWDEENKCDSRNFVSTKKDKMTWTRLAVLMMFCVIVYVLIGLFTGMWPWG